MKNTAVNKYHSNHTSDRTRTAPVDYFHAKISKIHQTILINRIKSLQRIPMCLPANRSVSVSVWNDFFRKQSVILVSDTAYTSFQKDNMRKRTYSKH